MTSRTKGNRVRNKAIKELEHDGYLVGIVERTGRFVKVKDLWDMFDLCAINKSGKIRFIQVKTNQTGGFIKKLEQFRLDFPSYATYELWCWIDRKGFNYYVK